MSIIDTLITDRTPADAALVRSLNATGWAAMTDEQRALYLSEGLKGAYKASDLNRVNAAMDYLVGRLKAQGINVPIKRSKIPHKGKRELPEGYTRVAWIENTDKQHIDTRFKPDQNTRLVLKGYNASTSTGWLYGCRNSGAAGMFGALATSGFKYGTETGVVDMSAIGPFEIDQNKNAYKYNGVPGVSAAQTFSCDYNLFLFVCNASGSVTSTRFFGRIEECQIYDDGILARDYVACITDSGVAGLYDFITETFDGNAGSGTFAYGDVIDESNSSEELDEFTWYDNDVPPPALLVEYLANVASVRSALVAKLPETPTDMDDGLTIEEANNIELVLVNIEQLINNMLSAWVYCAEIYSGEV